MRTGKPLGVITRLYLVFAMVATLFSCGAVYAFDNWLHYRYDVIVVVNAIQDPVSPDSPTGNAINRLLSSPPEAHVHNFEIKLYEAVSTFWSLGGDRIIHSFEQMPTLTYSWILLAPVIYTANETIVIPTSYLIFDGGMHEGGRAEIVSSAETGISINNDVHEVVIRNLNISRNLNINVYGNTAFSVGDTNHVN